MLTPCSRLTGRAGTGKTFSLLSKIAEDPYWGVLSASTGIAAINLNTTTVHSLLGFFDYKSLLDAYVEGRLHRKLRKIAEEGYSRVIIDEDSMIPAEVLDLLVKAFDEVNAMPSQDRPEPLGLMLSGDFAQLPPVKSRWAWEAKCWPRFESATTTLTKIWRQSDEGFLDALAAARRGDGQRCVELLGGLGVQFHSELDMRFDGTTIIAKNDKVDRFNDYVLSRLQGQKFSVRARAWGKATKRNPMTGQTEFAREFKNIPAVTKLGIGAYVIILVNQREESGELAYANGSCGHIAEVGERGVKVRLLNGAEYWIGPTCTNLGGSEKPDGWTSTKSGGGEYIGEPHIAKKGSSGKKQYVDGQIERYPLRLSWATTVHKSQGLSLDRVQIDFRESFFAQPGMGYVALSRSRTADGLRIVGSMDTVARRIKADPRIARWL